MIQSQTINGPLQSQVSFSKSSTMSSYYVLLYGHCLSTDWLQFGFKPKTGTTQCSWFVLEVASYYKTMNTSVKSALLDCSNAFDKCVFSVLFGKCLARRIPAIIVRGLLTIYMKQRCWVLSKDFGIGNGTRQGSCLSPALFSLYMDELLQELRNSGMGCYVGRVFAGAGSYCDDLVLLAPTRSGLQTLKTMCEKYALEHNVTFSTPPSPVKSKSK